MGHIRQRDIPIKKGINSKYKEMDIIKLVEKFIKLNISFSIQNDELLIEANEGVMTTKILEDISNNKEEIISLLKKK